MVVWPCADGEGGDVRHVRLLVHGVEEVAQRTCRNGNSFCEVIIALPIYRVTLVA